jgi:hypothetical protein
MYLDMEYRCNAQANLEVGLCSCKKFYKIGLRVAKTVNVAGARLGKQCWLGGFARRHV